VLVDDNNKLGVFCIVVDKLGGVVSILSFLLQENNTNPKRHNIISCFFVIILVITAIF
jgi:hypothetical protein